ncbi:MAG: hypothetical protein NTX24_04790 [Candidatus Pacearchaeota archaeon]|nr:hypothetical protein [Candidatus Pacearchaeota archaeon]
MKRKTNQQMIKSVISMFIIILIISTTFSSSVQIAKADETLNPEQSTKLLELLHDKTSASAYFSNKANFNQDPFLSQAYFGNISTSTFSFWRDKNLVYNSQNNEISNSKFVINLNDFYQDSLFFYGDKSIELNGNKIYGNAYISKANDTFEETFILKTNFPNLDKILVTFKSNNATINITPDSLVFQGHVVVDVFLKTKRKISFESFSITKINKDLKIESRDSSLTLSKIFEPTQNNFEFYFPEHKFQGTSIIFFKNASIDSIDKAQLINSSYFDDNFYANYNSGFFSYTLNKQNLFFNSKPTTSGIFIDSNKITARGIFSIFIDKSRLNINSENGNSVLEYSWTKTNDNYNYEYSANGNLSIDTRDYSTRGDLKISEKTTDNIKNLDVSLQSSQSAVLKIKVYSDDSYFSEALDIPITLKKSTSSFLIDEKTLKQITELKTKNGIGLYYSKIKVTTGNNVLNIDPETSWFNTIQIDKSITGQTIINIIGKAIQNNPETEPEGKFNVLSPDQVSQEIGQVNDEIWIDGVQNAKLETFARALREAKWQQASSILSGFKSSGDETNLAIYSRIKENDPILVEQLESNQFSSTFFKNLANSIDYLKKSETAEQEYSNIQKQFSAKNLKYDVSPVELECKNKYLLYNRFQIISQSGENSEQSPVEYKASEIASSIGVSVYQLYQLNKDQLLGAIYDFDKNEIIDSKTNEPFLFNENITFLAPDTPLTLSAKEQFVESLRTQVYASRYYKTAYSGIKSLTTADEDARQQVDNLNNQIANDKKVYAFHKFLRDNQIDKKIHDKKYSEASQLLDKYPEKSFVSQYIKEKLQDKEIDFSQGDIYAMPIDEQTPGFGFTGMIVANTETFSRNPLIQTLMGVDSSVKSGLESGIIKNFREQLGLNKESLLDSDALELLASYNALEEYTNKYKQIEVGINDKTIIPSEALEEEIAIINQKIADYTKKSDNLWFNAYRKFMLSSSNIPTKTVKSPLTNIIYDTTKTFEQNNFDKQAKDAIKFVVSVGVIVIAGIISGGTGAAVAGYLIEGLGATATYAATCAFVTNVVVFSVIASYGNAAIQSSFENEDILTAWNNEIGWNPEKGQIGQKFVRDISWNFVMFGVLQGTSQFFRECKFNYNAYSTLKTQGLSETEINSLLKTSDGKLLVSKFLGSGTGQLLAPVSELAIFDLIGIGQQGTEVVLSNELSKDEKLQAIKQSLEPSSIAKMSIDNAKFLIGLKTANSVFYSLTKSMQLTNELKANYPQMEATRQAQLKELVSTDLQIRDKLYEYVQQPTNDNLRQKLIDLQGQAQLLRQSALSQLGNSPEDILLKSEILDKAGNVPFTSSKTYQLAERLTIDSRVERTFLYDEKNPITRENLEEIFPNALILEGKDRIFTIIKEGNSWNVAKTTASAEQINAEKSSAETYKKTVVDAPGVGMLALPASNTVPISEIMQKYSNQGVVFIHALDPIGFSGYESWSLIRKGVSLQDRMNILLGLEPYIAASTITPGVGDKIWKGIGVILNGGDITYACPGSACSISKGIYDRVTSIGAQIPRGQLDTDIDVAVKREYESPTTLSSEYLIKEYNEFGVKNPKVAAFYISLDSKFKNSISTSTALKYIQEICANLGLPLYTIKDGRIYEIKSIEYKTNSNGDSISWEFILGKEISNQEILQSDFELSPQNKQKMMRDLFAIFPFSNNEIQLYRMWSMGREAYIDINSLKNPSEFEGEKINVNGEVNIAYIIKNGQIFKSASTTTSMGLWENYGFPPKAISLRLNGGCFTFLFSPREIPHPSSRPPLLESKDFLTSIQSLSKSKLEDVTREDLAYALYGFGEEAAKHKDFATQKVAFEMAERMGFSEAKYENIRDSRGFLNNEFKMFLEDFSDKDVGLVKEKIAAVFGYIPREFYKSE